MTTHLGKSYAFMDLVRQLYNTPVLCDNLNEIKRRMRPAHRYTSPQFDDVEAEIVCLLLMHLSPKTIYEFSPCGGWSTLYMLHSLHVANNSDCNLLSFDIVDKCFSNIKKFAPPGAKWGLHVGNVEDKYASFPETIDYLFIDSDHSAPFAEKYIDELLTPLLASSRRLGRKIVVSVHDVFHTSTPSEEGALVIRFLESNNIEYFSPRNYSHHAELSSLRLRSGIDTADVHYYKADSCIFFLLGA